MLDSLDTLIAFAVVMSLLSLIVTIITQMVAATLSLRGTNLANALALTFQTVNPQIGRHAHALAERILTDPLLSDSTWRTKTRGAASLPKDVRATVAEIEAIKRAVTDAEQAVAEFEKKIAAAPQPAPAALVASRNAATAQLTAARDDLARVESDPAVHKTLQDHHETLEGKLRKSPVSAWWPNAWTYASAVRPDEVYRILREISQLDLAEAAQRGLAASLQDASTQLLGALAVPGASRQEATDRIQAALAVGEVLPEPIRLTILQSFAGLADNLTQATGQSYDRFERWFSSAQDRAKQWFAAHTRRITIVGAGLVAIGLQVDTLDLFHTLTIRPEVRANLGRAAGVILEQGGKILDSTDTADRHTYLVWLREYPGFTLEIEPESQDAAGYTREIAKRLAGAPNFTPEIQEFTSTFREFKDLPGDDEAGFARFKETYDAWRENFPTLDLSEAPIPPAYAERYADFQARLQTHAAAVKKDATSLAAAVKRYADLKTEGAKHYLADRQQRFAVLKQQSDTSGLELVWPTFPEGWRDRLKQKNAWGILITVALLSLGAPFWYNVLRQMTNLRPMLATLVEQRPSQSTPPAGDQKEEEKKG
ncbi:MAG: hypothetical protein QOE70_4250 [Chthoniobacter sp.]|jgi:hypothetical protein|nr:hypothetical protein [Chthoniobacter sp.]